jgi:hypothetical protein
MSSANRDILTVSLPNIMGYFDLKFNRHERQKKLPQIIPSLSFDLLSYKLNIHKCNNVEIIKSFYHLI